MSTESIAVNKVRTLLDESRILEAYLSVNDKTPFWDGYLLLYDRKGHRQNKKFFVGKLHVQVKGKAVKKHYKKDVINYSIKYSLLDKFRTNEGTLFFVVTVLYHPDDSITTEIFMARLLPLDILRIQNSKPKEECISIELKRISTITEIEIECLFFRKNLPLQTQTDTRLPQTQDITGKQLNFEISGLCKDFLEIPQHDHFVYIIADYNSRIPTLLQVKNLKAKSSCTIKSGETTLFTNYEFESSSDDGISLFFYDALFKFTTNSDKSTLMYHIEESTTLEHVFAGNRFLKAIRDTSEFYINNVPFRLDGENSISSPENNAFFSNWDEIERCLSIININTEKVTIRNLYDNKELVDDLYSFLIKKERVHIDSTKSIIFKSLYLFYKEIPLIFSHEGNKNYLCQFLFNENLHQFSYEDKGVNVPCSPFLALLFFYNKHIYEKITCLVDNEDAVYRDLTSLYDERIIDKYIEFILACIKGYDVHHIHSILDLAEKLLYDIQIKTKKTNTHLHATIFVNLAQIKIRKNGDITLFEKRKLKNMIRNLEDSISIKCCCMILLGETEAFKKEFQLLTKKDKALFRQWPIFNLITKD